MFASLGMHLTFYTDEGPKLGTSVISAPVHYPVTFKQYNVLGSITLIKCVRAFGAHQYKV